LSAGPSRLITASAVPGTVVGRICWGRQCQRTCRTPSGWSCTEAKAHTVVSHTCCTVCCHTFGTGPYTPCRGIWTGTLKVVIVFFKIYFRFGKMH
jgi:hypothetical protein